MGGKGPAKTPSAVLKMRGSPWGRNRTDEPLPAPGAPEPPEWLTGEALAEWQRIVPAMDAIKLLSAVDRAGLAIMCQSWADYCDGRARLAEQGDVFTTDKGYIAKNPLATIVNEAFARWSKMSAQFGLTPSARASLAIERKNPDENRGKREKFFGVGA